MRKVPGTGSDGQQLLNTRVDHCKPAPSEMLRGEEHLNIPGAWCHRWVLAVALSPTHPNLTWTLPVSLLLLAGVGPILKTSSYCLSRCFLFQRKMNIAQICPLLKLLQAETVSSPQSADNYPWRKHPCQIGCGRRKSRSSGLSTNAGLLRLWAQWKKQVGHQCPVELSPVASLFPWAGKAAARVSICFPSLDKPQRKAGPLEVGSCSSSPEVCLTRNHHGLALMRR